MRHKTKNYGLQKGDFLQAVAPWSLYEILEMMTIEPMLETVVVQCSCFYLSHPNRHPYLIDAV
jgi:hypothetical protein